MKIQTKGEKNFKKKTLPSQILVKNNQNEELTPDISV